MVYKADKAFRWKFFKVCCATGKKIYYISKINNLFLSRLGSRAADMDDILIVSSQQSQAAALWVNYLKVCFSQINKSRKKPPFK
jgi:hypothetical protein